MGNTGSSGSAIQPGPAYTPTQTPIKGGLVTPSNLPVLTPTGQILSPPDLDNFTAICNPVYVREQHITVIRRGPTMPPLLEMDQWDENKFLDKNYDKDIILSDDFYASNMNMRYDPNTTAAVDNIPDDGGDAISCFYTPGKELKQVGDEILLYTQLNLPGNIDLEDNYKVIIKHSFTNSLGIIQVTSVRGTVLQKHQLLGARIELTSTPTNKMYIKNRRLCIRK